MSERIITLFGEEIVPEQVKAVGKSRAKKKPQEKTTEVEEAIKETTESLPEALSANDAILSTNDAIEETQQEELKTIEIPQPVNSDQAPQIEQPALKVNQVADVPEETLTVTESPIENKEPEEKVTKAKTKKAEKVNLSEDWDGDKQYYSIGEVATLFNVKTSHIRFWTNEFKLKVRTTRKGDRLFTPEQIKELRAIHHLVKERGFTLSGAKAKLKTQNKIDVETIDLKQSLLQLRNKLLIIRNQLT